MTTTQLPLPTELPTTATTLIGDYPTYAAAQQAVDYLSDHDSPVQHATIVGVDLRLVETVTGRLTVARAAASGAAAGAWFGLLAGAVLALFTNAAWLAVLAVAALGGALWGAIMAAVAHAATRGRDFASHRRPLPPHRRRRARRRRRRRHSHPRPDQRLPADRDPHRQPPRSRRPALPHHRQRRQRLYRRVDAALGTYLRLHPAPLVLVGSEHAAVEGARQRHLPVDRGLAEDKATRSSTPCPRPPFGTNKTCPRSSPSTTSSRT